MNVSLSSPLTGSTMQGKVAVLSTNVACRRFGLVSGNEHFHRHDPHL